MRLLGLVILCGWGTVALADAAVEDRHPDTRWIWTQSSENPKSKQIFVKDVQISKPIAKAHILAVTDFCAGTVMLNGKPVGELIDFGLPLRKDVTQLLRAGKNTLQLACRGSDGPSAVAACLMIEFRDGSELTIPSDETWRSDHGPVVASEPVATAMLPNPTVDTAINPFDDYTQWKRTLKTDAGLEPASFSLPERFTIERVYSAGADEGSWVSIEFDEKGRLIVAREDRGLLRMTLPRDGKPFQVETVNDTLKECRGLLSAHGSLYAHANNSKGLYRLRDTTGDDQYDKVELLYQSNGGVGHGRNDLALGPDGKIYAIFGDSVDLPRGFPDRTSPFREHAQGQKSREGHVVRFDADGSHGEIFAAGLRNPYGIAFHPEGDAFTYDADAEYDMGSPWYRPTRIVQLQSGADYGWRGVTKSWPPDYPDHADNTPPVLDIGKGSPTGVKFGTKSHFPAKYQNALFVSDWAYGRVLAVDLTPKGAGYAGRASVFLKGQAFNVTDLDFGPDGAMYLITGGRKTQSALYRVRYEGSGLDEPASEVADPQQHRRDAHAKAAKTLRKNLEELHRNDAKNAIAMAWPHLGSADPVIRHAARMAIEHRPISEWQTKALTEPQTTAALNALLALTRVPENPASKEILLRLIQLSPDSMTQPQLQMWADCLRLCLERTDDTSLAIRTDISRMASPLFPLQSQAVNRSLLQVLALIDSPMLVPEVLDWLPTATDQADRLHGLFLLRNARRGWTPERRDRYFAALQTMQTFRGGQGMPTFVQRVGEAAVKSLPEDLRAEFQKRLDWQDSTEELPKTNRPVVKDWVLKDLADVIDQPTSSADFEKGRELYQQALCSRCHRMGFTGGAVGPDLTGVGRRFRRRDLLESILEPSKVVADSYRLAKVQTTDGKVFSGQVIPHRDYRAPELLLATDPLAPHKITEIPKANIEIHTMSNTSVMPADLLNTFTKDEIRELLTYLETGGNPNHPRYRSK